MARNRLQREVNIEPDADAQDPVTEPANNTEDGDAGRTLATRSHAAALMSLLGQQGSGVPVPFCRDILLMQTMINGAMHVEDIHARAAALQEGAIVRLVLEPDNPADPRAILVRDPDGHKIGYIPRVKNEVLYHLLDAGKCLYGVVVGGDIGEHLDEEDTWVEIYIEVYMKD